MTTGDQSFGLQLHGDLSDRRKFTFAFSALFLLLFIIYGNSFEGAWLLDDFPQIVNNGNIRIESLSGPEIVRSLYRRSYQTQAERLSNRPLASLSFALNYYFGGMNVSGYHAVNFAIHVVTAFFLFLVIYRTLQLPLLKERTGESSYAIALLATFFWASSPVQVNAVTYIVQRMTSMAGMFYLMAIYFYLRGRTQATPKISPYLFSLVCGGLALATKEIAAMLPVSILLYELVLIQGIPPEQPLLIVRRNRTLLIVLISCALAILTIVAFFYGRLLDYSRWTFSLKERLLTEPRVILHYLSLLFYPAGSRLMMDYDIELSHSLLHPATTLPAVLAVVGIIGYAFSLARKTPLLSFGILFFFLNHFIEGSFIPLDIAFAHRNYVPSMFLFVPPATAAVRGLDCLARRRSLQLAATLGIAVLLAAQALTVYARNDILRSPKLLWQDNILKAPRLSRPHAALGALLYAEGNYREAARETAQALELANYPNVTQPAIYHTNLGLADYELFRENDDGALAHFQAALKIQSDYAPAHHGVALVMLRKGLFPQARASCERALGYEPGNAYYQATRTRILLKDTGVKPKRETP